MNKSAIKKFAITARQKLIEAVEQKAYELGITKTYVKETEIYQDGFLINHKFYKKYEMNQRETLIRQVNQKGFDQVVEEVAYTWFNRFIALRFMEVNDYLPTGIRVFSSIEADKAEPDALTEVHVIADELDLNIKKVYQLQDENDTEDLYKYILVKQCNKLGEIMPMMFERIEDYTELLLPDHLLAETSVVYDMVGMIEEKDWTEEVEIVGWLYQYYISEKKDQVFSDLKKNKKISKENIPAATELFTPRWIVQYMVDNALGHLWSETHPDYLVKDQLPYFVEEAEQTERVKEQLKPLKNLNLAPESIKFFDPCMGSGHILVYAFEILYNIYKSQGYKSQDIPFLILKHNLYGLDIDRRAAQLAYFSVIMKARQYNDRLFDQQIVTNVQWIEESNALTEQDIDLFIGDQVSKTTFVTFLNLFQDARLYGSIIEIPHDLDLVSLKNRVETLKENHNDDMFDIDFKDHSLPVVERLMDQAEILSEKFDVVVTNPPYMGRKGMNAELTRYVKMYYKDSSADLFAVFMEVAGRCVKDNGFIGLVNQHSWMFLSSFEKLRETILSAHQIYSMAHLGTRAFAEIGGEVVQTTSFVMRKNLIPNYLATYIRLTDIKDAENKAQEFYNKELYYHRTQDGFTDIPGSPIAYWASEQIRKVFKENPILGEVAEPRQGLATGDNALFLRWWFEVSVKKIHLFRNNDNKWIPISKGGSFRKWFGNNYYVVNWENEGNEIRNFRDEKGKLRSRPQNLSYYFREGITWSTLSSGSASFRFHPANSIFETKGSVLFPKDAQQFSTVLAYVNSKLVNLLLKVITPTLDFHEGPIGRLPFIFLGNQNIDPLVKHTISLSKSDWDSFETSWDFKKHPFLEFKQGATKVAEAYANWEKEAEQRFQTLKANEEELNRIFIDLYELQDELSPEVEDKEVTVRRAEQVRDVKSFLSYAVGLMFGRYSLDEEGLAFAGGTFELAKYESFKPNNGNVMPISEDIYFEDDIVLRFIQIIQIIFGEKALEDNLDFIADTLTRKSNETSRQRIRRYFLKEFYKDHVQTYQKRPIYWMFDSGKENGFKALIYMHRYEQGLVSRVRTEYLHLQQRKYEGEMDRIDILLESFVSHLEKTKAKKQKEKLHKQLLECLQYDQVIAHVANQKIDLDFDDGVKVNYAKFQGVEVPQGEGKKPLKANVLANI